MDNQYQEATIAETALRDKGRIDSQLDNLQAGIDTLGEQVNNYLERTKPVRRLVGVSSNNAKGDEPPKEETSVIADRLYEMSRQVERLRAMVNEATTELEL